MSLTTGRQAKKQQEVAGKIATVMSTRTMSCMAARALLRSINNGDDDFWLKRTCTAKRTNNLTAHKKQKKQRVTERGEACEQQHRQAQWLTNKARYPPSKGTQ